MSQFESRDKSRSPRATSAAERTTSPRGLAGTIPRVTDFSRVSIKRFAFRMFRPAIARQDFAAGASPARSGFLLSRSFLLGDHVRLFALLPAAILDGTNPTAEI